MFPIVIGQKRFCLIIDTRGTQKVEKHDTRRKRGDVCCMSRRSSGQVPVGRQRERVEVKARASFPILYLDANDYFALHERDLQLLLLSPAAAEFACMHVAKNIKRREIIRAERELGLQIVLRVIFASIKLTN